MGQVLHGSAKTTHAIRAAIQRSQASIKELSERYDLNPKTVAKWKKRDFIDDAPMGPKDVHSTVLSVEEEALAVAFRKHTLLPLDDCLYPGFPRWLLPIAEKSNTIGIPKAIPTRSCHDRLGSALDRVCLAMRNSAP